MKELEEEINNHIEYLDSIEEYDIPCISMENLEAILSKYLNYKFELGE